MTIFMNHPRNGLDIPIIPNKRASGVGVQLPSGFTDLAVVPQGDPLNPTTNALGFVTDQFAVVTTAQCAP